MQKCRCGRDYYPKQRWIHEPLCRYIDDVAPNHVKPENRFPLSVTETVTVAGCVTERVTVLSNAERQRRWRENQKQTAGSAQR